MWTNSLLNSTLIDCQMNYLIKPLSLSLSLSLTKPPFQYQMALSSLLGAWISNQFANMTHCGKCGSNHRTGLVRVGHEYAQVTFDDGNCNFHARS